MPRSNALLWCAIAALAAVLAFAVVRLAWICDDAYITLRVVDNILNGYGPVWNAGERVQTHTHPAWMGLLSAACWLTGEHYFTTLGVSMLLSTAAVVLLLVIAGRVAAPVALLVLLASRCFGDYATSGLEAPLTMFLVALLGLIDARTPQGGQRLRVVSLLMALLVLSRLDLLVLAAPLVLANLRVPAGRAVANLAVGLLPLAAWTVFATIYYGSPVPATAHAKALSNGIGLDALLEQGFWYCVNAVRREPATVATIFVGIAVGLLRRELRGRALAVGALLYCAYIVRVGGDHMAGRFFVPPFLASLVLLLRWLRSTRGPIAPAVSAAAAVALAFAGEGPAYLHPVQNDLEKRFWEHDIDDERRFYFNRLGLLSPNREIPVPGKGSRSARGSGRERPMVFKVFTAGVGPYEAGDLFYFVDPWLCDPLLVRLPVFDPQKWNVGHYTRRIPDGYLESLANGDSRLLHPGLRRYYDCLRRVIRDPVWSGDRLQALLDMQFGRFEADRRAYVDEEYRRPPRRPVDAAAMPQVPGLEGTFWFDAPSAHVVGMAGLRIRCGVVEGAGTLQVTATPLIQYRLTFRSGEQQVGERVLTAAHPVGGLPADELIYDYLRDVFGLYSFSLDLPKDMPAFDCIDVDCEAPELLVPVIAGVAFR